MLRSKLYQHVLLTAIVLDGPAVRREYIDPQTDAAPMYEPDVFGRSASAQFVIK